MINMSFIFVFVLNKRIPRIRIVSNRLCGTERPLKGAWYHVTCFWKGESCSFQTGDKKKSYSETFLSRFWENIISPTIMHPSRVWVIGIFSSFFWGCQSDSRNEFSVWIVSNFCDRQFRAERLRFFWLCAASYKNSWIVCFWNTLKVWLEQVLCVLHLFLPQFKTVWNVHMPWKKRAKCPRPPQEELRRFYSQMNGCL